ncbi:MAG: long-chain fatty acid--CoA ligase [bacterium]|nr:long-chain fatty acid--CoA ligase [bacterium]
MAATDPLTALDRCESLGRMLEVTAGRHPRRKAVIADEGGIRYRELDRAANRMAHALDRRAGVRPGDRVAILLGNGVPFVEAAFGALKAGAVVIPLNTYLTAPELRYILSDGGASVLVSSDRFARTVRRFSGDLPSLRTLVTAGREDLGGDTRLREEFIRGMPASSPDRHPRRDDLSILIYTSGTTGRPKGAMLTHGNILSNVAGSGRAIEIRGRDRLLLVLPMFHSFTLTACIFMPVAVGARVIVVERVRSLRHLLARLIMRRVTLFIGIPHLYDMIAASGLPFWARPLLRLRLCVSGAAPLSAATLERFAARVRIPLLEGYGLSETSPVVSINPLRGVRKAGSVGRPIPGVDVRIVDGEGRELPPNESGEIAVRGPNVMRGYHNLPRETKETIRDGWLRTGDIGKMDEDGYIFILDRKKEMILFHGMNVYPREIEEVLYAHPDVAEAAVVGRSDRHRGEVPVAFVSLKEGGRARPADLVAHCRESLASYKVPHRMTIMERLPRTSTGKILKRELKNGPQD